MIIQREAAASLEITAEIVRAGAVMLQLPDDIFGLLERITRQVDLLFEHIPLHPVAQI